MRVRVGESYEAIYGHGAVAIEVDDEDVVTAHTDGPRFELRGVSAGSTRARFSTVPDTPIPPNTSSTLSPEEHAAAGGVVEN